MWPGQLSIEIIFSCKIVAKIRTLCRFKNCGTSTFVPLKQVKKNLLRRSELHVGDRTSELLALAFPVGLNFHLRSSAPKFYGKVNWF